MSSYKKMIERRHKDDEATAFAFQEFIDTFQNANPSCKTFVKSGVYNPGKSEQTDDDRGKLYSPSPFIKLPSQENSKKAIECARLLKETKFEKGKCTAKPKSNLEMLKEELKQRHLERDGRHKQKRCDVDSSEASDVTTNLFLTNLSPKLNEQDLMQIFGVFGPLASVKIMWPRMEERSRDSNIGFVAYMSRKDGERAFAGLSNRDDMRVSWGKPIEIPTQPIYIPPDLVKLMLPPPYSGLPFNAQPLKEGYAMPKDEREMAELLHRSVVKVTVPLDKKLLMVIHRVVEFVVREGPMFEAMLMHKEINNPTFHFLFDNKSATHVYYRWKLFSVMNGEAPMNWSTKPFRMFKGGSIWVPPTIPDYTKGMIDHFPSKNESETLSENQQGRLVQIVQNLNSSRKKIAEAMLFCLKHAAAYADVVCIICESFDNPATSPTKKIARLYLVSDILYNTKFKRQPFKNFPELFEARLSGIFEQLEATYRRLGQMGDKNAFRSRVLKVLRAWEMWRTFSGEFVDKLESTLLGESCDDSGNDEPLDGKILLSRSLGYNAGCIQVGRNEDEVLANFVPSKWETLDPAEIESQAMSTQKLRDIENARIEKERRLERLRQIELKVLKLQDELESGLRKTKKRRSIEEEVNAYRKKCVERLLSPSSSSDDEAEARRKKRKHK